MDSQKGFSVLRPGKTRPGCLSRRCVVVGLSLGGALRSSPKSGCFFVGQKWTEKSGQISGQIILYAIAYEEKGG